MSILRKSQLLFICVFLFVGCSNSKENPIIGTWENISSSQFGRAYTLIEFRSDGTYTQKIGFPDFERLAREKYYTYAFADMLSAIIIGRYTLTADELVLSPQKLEGPITRLQRAKDAPAIDEFDHIYPYEFEDTTLILFDERAKPLRYNRVNISWLDRWLG